MASIGRTVIVVAPSARRSAPLARRNRRRGRPPQDPRPAPSPARLAGDEPIRGEPRERPCRAGYRRERSHCSRCPMPRRRSPDRPAVGGRQPSEIPLSPGQVVQPIDLANALRLAGARDLDIATARQQVLQSLAELDQARGLWLPSLFTGPTYYRARRAGPVDHRPGPDDRPRLAVPRHDGQPGQQLPRRAPGSGFPPLNSLSGVLRISDAIYGVRAARRVIAANEAGVRVATNNALLAVVRGVLRPPAGRRDARHRTRGRRQRRGPGGHHGDLRPVRGGPGGRPPPHPDRTPEPAAVHPGSPPGSSKVASANLVRPLVLDPHVVVAPVEPAETVIRLVAGRRPARRPDLPGLAEPARAGAGPGAGPGGRAAAQAGEAPPVRPERWP